MTQQAEFDPVERPAHYHGNKLQAIDVIEAWGLDFRFGNAVKYILRAKRKGNCREDLQKAKWYIARAAVHGWVCSEGALDPADIAEDFALTPVLTQALVLLLTAKAAGGVECLDMAMRRIDWQIALDTN